MLDKAYTSIATYIAQNVNNPARDMDLATLKKYALLGQDKVDAEKLKVQLEEIETAVFNAEQQKVKDALTRKHEASLADITERQRELKKDTDKNAADIIQSGEKLSVRQREAMNNVLDKIKQDGKGFFEKQMEAIKNGEREMAAKFNSRFSEVDNKLPVIVDELKSEVAGFEKRLAEQKAEREANIPVPPETEEIFIEETGQVITIEKR